MTNIFLLIMISTTVMETNPIKIVLNAGISIYQKVISPAQGDVCNFSPSCSNFSRQAFSKYGAIIGLLMTADRLMRCQPGAVDYYDRYYHGLRDHKIFDPVENNYIFGPIEWRWTDDLDGQ